MSNEQLNVSVSIGVATGVESWEALFNRADASLFKAKAQGRNKVGMIDWEILMMINRFENID